ncbi:hypothetical protein VM1G_02154 [Cytospora mali]|uniref:Lytic polysaccharide monooxygenase n=1 Tax=Cytospora mali TaxID=578113 RepID=A0A194VQQ4_CYTMA|nr:hypothetical protein VM1G_02154 [Valsa mali]
MHGSHTTTLATASLVILLVSVQLALADNNIQRRHVQLVTPQPYAWDEYGPTNPLKPDGSDYPCKVPQGGKFQVNGTPTEMVIGEAQVVSFAGWAVHGGGSCQFALTEGMDPGRDSAWKVIHSIEGGCPKANVAGNLDAGQSPDNYTFTIPDDFGPGDYTFAWTWVNRIAESPEFYMNCAPITVKAAAGSTRRVKERREAARSGRRDDGQTSYPDLFLANIGNASNGCDTSEALHEQFAIEYPYPGDSVSYPDGTANLFKQPCDGNPRNNKSSVASGDPSASSASGSTAGLATASSISSLTTMALTSSVTSTGSVPSLDSSTASTSASTTSQHSSSVIIVVSTAASTAAASSASSLSGVCTDGHLMCVGGTQFSTCTGGAWTTPQDLASNARCKEEGESVGLDITNIS